MRLAYLVLDPGIPIGGTKGAAVHAEAITRALRAAGHEVVIFATRVAEDHESTCPVEVLALPVELRAGVKAVGGLIARTRPDYRLDRDLKALLLNATLAAPLAHRLTAFRADVVLERLSLFGLAGLEAARAAGVPHAIEMNAPLTAEALSYRGLTATPLADAIEKQVLLGTDVVLPVSRSLEGYCRSIGVPGERITVVPNGVDLATFTPQGAGAGVRARLGFAPEDLVVGMVSGFRPWHGGRDLVRAFVVIADADPRARLLAVGAGPELEPMADLLTATGLQDRARLAGAVPHAEVPGHLEAMDVAVAPYLPAAGFYFSPLKIYEYMAMARAIVASALGQIDEVIADGINGRLVAAGDPKALAGAIASLFASAAERERLGTAARHAASERHAWNRAAKRIEVRLFELIERAGTGAGSWDSAQEVKPCSA